MHLLLQVCMWANGARELAAAWKLPRLGICMQLIEVGVSVAVWAESAAWCSVSSLFPFPS